MLSRREAKSTGPRSGAVASNRDCLDMPMLPINWKKFLHPAGVYRLEYPAHWDQVQQDEARACGFGPHERDDVGLWISLMPVSVDSDRMAEGLPQILDQVLPRMGGGNIRSDP